MTTLRARNSKIGKAALFAAMSSLVVVGLQAQTAETTEKKDEVQKLEKFEVTGSRIKRLDTETPSPVVEFKIGDVEAQGFTKLGDFIQSLPMNTGSMNSVIQTASFTRGAATVNPRGLGGNRVLVLVNGRRSISYALTNSNNQSVFDFNSIPLAAIDSIHFLKDGASAIYGSDAVTGVFDIRLKKNYNGVSANMKVENTLGHDSLSKTADVVIGTQKDKTSMVVVASANTGNSTYIRDYDRSKTTDYSWLGAKGANLNSSANWPANITFSATQAAAAGYTTGAGSYVLTGGVPTSTPTKAGFARVASIPNENRYDFAKTYQLYPEYDSYGVYAHIDHQITPHLSVFGEVMYNTNTTNYNFTPAVIQSTQNPGTSTTGTLNIPSSNPYNPFGIDINNFLYRTNFGDVRKFDTKGNTTTLLAGLKGDFGADWTWEAAVSRGLSDVTTVSRNQIRAVDLQAALNGTTRTTALNPFGVSDNPDVVSKLFTVSNSTYNDTAQQFDANAQGTLFSLPAGRVGLAVGGEFRKETIQQDPDTASYVGSGGGTPYKGSRRVVSEYAELSIPILKSVPGVDSLEAQLAVRHEDYNDFGKTTKPKYALIYKLPTNRIVDIALRGSYSESFKAPDLGRLYTATTTGFSSTVLSDPKRPGDPATQLKIVTGGNPLLKPEEAKIKYAGIVVDVKAVKGLSFAVDYFDLAIDNVISSPSSTTLLAREDQFPGAVVRDNTQGNPGPILYLKTVPFNVAKQWYKGYDFEVKYQLKNTPVGDFNFVINATRTVSVLSNSGIRDSAGNLPANFENVGLYNNPKWIATASAAWRYKKMGAVIAMPRYMGKYFNDAYTVAGWGENPKASFNVSFSYDLPYDIRLSVGSNNVLDTEAPLNGRETSSYDQSTYAWLARGRTIWMGLAYNF